MRIREVVTHIDILDYFDGNRDSKKFQVTYRDGSREIFTMEEWVKILEEGERGLERVRQFQNLQQGFTKN